MAQVVDAFLVLASFRDWVMLLEPVAFVAGFDDVAVMSQAVEQGRGHLRIGNSTTRTRVFRVWWCRSSGDRAPKTHCLRGAEADFRVERAGNGARLGGLRVVGSGRRESSSRYAVAARSGARLPGKALIEDEGRFGGGRCRVRAWHAWSRA